MVFYITTLFVLFLVISGIWGYFCLHLSHHSYHQKIAESSGHNCSKLMTKHSQEECEVTEEILRIIKPKVVFVVVVLAIILNVMIQSFTAIFRGNQTAQFFNRSLDYAHKIGFKASRRLKLKIKFEICFIVFFLICMVTLYFIPENYFASFYPAEHFVRDTVLAIKLMTLRPFISDPRSLGSKTTDEVVNLLILFSLIYLYTTYKINIMFYSYICKAISSSFKSWNRKTKSYFTKPQQFVIPKNQLIEKLASDHFILLKLVKITDDLYGPIITTYFFSQIVIICFIIYVIIDLGLSIMSTLALMILVQTSILLYMVTCTASRVHEEATLGFDSLRTASMKNLGFREEKVLRALLTSFGGPPVYMTGSKMFNIHRPTILTIFSIIATYFVVLFQIIRYWD